jgi:uncharacterized protein (DUF2141 family)
MIFRTPIYLLLALGGATTLWPVGQSRAGASSATSATQAQSGRMSAGSSTDKGLSFTISGLKRGGTIRCALFNSEDAFLKKPAFGAIAKGQKGRAVCRFSRVPKGTYAMAAFHDINDNKKLDTNWIGIPSEGTCTSNNAKGRFGPPKWKDALFAYRGGQLAQRLAIDY